MARAHAAAFRVVTYSTRPECAATICGGSAVMRRRKRSSADDDPSARPVAQYRSASADNTSCKAAHALAVLLPTVLQEESAQANERCRDGPALHRRVKAADENGRA
eukprot:CAMPEP_0206166124 /NCGR_PEP_ID=MMETSP1474-20131121/22946_1 /ASSEMBLY_ACC=CAM_ASM_001110 /TAXON_ID=97495 /ORGANISM="Imantonia sp., Strain RCC918" /LENGTH=105 /DNA_ID=CAMNT_0053569933 /DNA_START=182 /DNA_END=497 /DNA_ORIENTATION=+